MIQKCHRFHFTRQKLLLEVDWRALLADNLQSYSATKLLRQCPLNLHPQLTVDRATGTVGDFKNCHIKAGLS